MPLARAFFNVITDALFPVPVAEQAVMSMGPLLAFKSLPRAPRPRTPEACAIFSYKDERVSRLIWSIKYKRSGQGATVAGYALYYMTRSFARSLPSDMKLLLVPMPITARRRRERGFNQCELLADALKRFDLCNDIIIEKHLLRRVQHTSRQTLKDREGRLESLKDAFVVDRSAAESYTTPPRSPAKYFVVVIDDVITTGSTIKEAVSAIRAAGFTNTWGMSVAH